MSYSSLFAPSTPPTSRDDAPAAMSALPSASVTQVGYHRAAGIGAWLVHAIVSGLHHCGLKVRMSLSAPPPAPPGPPPDCPPATSNRPSGRKQWPAQNRFRPSATAAGVTGPVRGSQSWAFPLLMLL